MKTFNLFLGYFYGFGICFFLILVTNFKVFSQNNNSDSVVNADCNYFYFDPNFVTDVQLIKLGFTAKQTEAFIEMRNKGTKFYCVNDLKYNFLFKNRFEELKNCVKIDFEKLTDGKKMYDLNCISQEDLENFVGLSRSEAVKIIELRNILGNFYSVHQLMDIKSIDYQRYNKIKSLFYICSPDSFKTVKINEISADELQKHPYFSKKQALAVVDYRQKHIKISCQADLLSVGCFDSFEVKKIVRYVEF